MFALQRSARGDSDGHGGRHDAHRGRLRHPRQHRLLLRPLVWGARHAAHLHHDPQHAGHLRHHIHRHLLRLPVLQVDARPACLSFLFFLKVVFPRLACSWPLNFFLARPPKLCHSSAVHFY